MKKIAIIFICFMTVFILASCGITYEELEAEREREYQLGYDAGYDAGYEAGHFSAWSDGRTSGYDEGYDVGYKEGHDDGFYKGYTSSGSSGNSSDTEVDVSDYVPWDTSTSGFEEYRNHLISEYGLDEPASGTILSGSEYYGSEITVTASGSSSYVVKLKTETGAEVVCFYIRAGETVTIGVPAEYLYVYFAAGETWYGEDLLFGADTTYSKDDEVLDFVEYSWEYTLYPVVNGNFSETPIDESEF